jgi:hypothetical protein
MAIVTRQYDVPFVPAYADRFCAHCGFPFRGSDRGRQYCHQFDLPNHGRCERRRQDAANPEGLQMRLRATQQADPRSTRTIEDAVAHAWVRLHYPNVNIRNWKPAQEP